AQWAPAGLSVSERSATIASTLAAGLVALCPFLLAHSDLPGGAVAALLGAAGVVVAVFVYLLLHPRAARRWLGRLLPARFAPRLDVLGAFGRRDARSLMLLSALRYGVFSAPFVCLVRAF